MSAETLSLVTARPSLDGRALAVALGAFACGSAALADAGTFAAVAALVFAAAAAWPFVRDARRGLDTGQVLYFFLFYFVFAMLLRGIGLLTFVDSPYLRDVGDRHSPSFVRLIAWTFVGCAAGLVSLHLGFASPSAARAARALLVRAPGLAAPWPRVHVRRVGLALMAIGAIGALLRLRSLGGFLAAAGDPLIAGTEAAVGHWWTVALTEFAVVGFHVLCIGEVMSGRRHALTRLAGLGLVLAVPLYLVTSSKFLVIRFLFVPLLLRHFLVKRVPIQSLALCFVGFGALFPLFYAYRALGLLGLEGVGDYLAADRLPILKIYNRAYDADTFALVMHRVSEGLPLQWGRTLLDLGTFWIPRAFWPGKPISFGLWFSDVYMPDVHFGVMTYVSPSLPGELWANAHVPGLLAGFWALGWVMRAAWEAVRRGGPAMLLVYIYAFLTLVHLVEGSIAAQLETMLTGVVPALLAMFAFQRLRAGRAA